MSLKRKWKNGERGQAMVEFALISVVFFTFVFGIMDGARLFQSWMALQHASREGARYAITGQTSCTGFTTRAACITYTAKKATTGLSRGGATGADVSVTYKAWDYDTWSGTGTAGVTGKQCDQIEVTVTYTHQFVTPILKAAVPSGINIKGSQRMTNEPWGACTIGDGLS